MLKIKKYIHHIVHVGEGSGEERERVRLYLRWQDVASLECISVTLSLLIILKRVHMFQECLLIEFLAPSGAQGVIMSVLLVQTCL